MKKLVALVAGIAFSLGIGLVVPQTFAQAPAPKEETKGEMEKKGEMDKKGGKKGAAKKKKTDKMEKTDKMDKMEKKEEKK
jgi:hypothetical protein